MTIQKKKGRGGFQGIPICSCPHHERCACPLVPWGRKARGRLSKCRQRERNWRYAGVKDFSFDAFESMFKLQDGKCAICRRVLDFTSPNTVVDHDHDTGMVRGVLCKLCNSTLWKTFSMRDYLRDHADDDQRGKFTYFDFLIFTQVHEIYESDPGSVERAKEECDLINSCLDDMIVHGQDPVSTFNARYGDGDKGKQVAAIVRKYRSRWEAIQKEEERRK